MKRAVKIALVLMMVLTVVSVGVVYASENNAKPVDLKYYPGVTGVAALYQGQPRRWYYPEQLPILDIEILPSNLTKSVIKLIYATAYNKTLLTENTTLLSFKIPFLPPELLKNYATTDLEGVIIKYEDKFYQYVAAGVLYDPAPPPGILIGRLPTLLGAALGAGWLLTGVFYFRGRKQK